MFTHTKTTKSTEETEQQDKNLIQKNNGTS